MSSKESPIPSPSSWQEWAVFIAILVIAAGAFVSALSALYHLVILDQDSLATNFGNVAAGLSMVVLVAITTWYAYESRRLVRVSEKSREEEQLRRRRERHFELNNLRKALVREITAIDDLHSLARGYNAAFSFYHSLAPSHVYEANADKIGLLTEEEIDAIVEYYTEAKLVEDLLYAQRQTDSFYEMSLFEQIYYVLSFTWWFHRKDIKQREEQIAERIAGLAERQSEAHHIIERHIANNQDSIEATEGENRTEWNSAGEPPEGDDK